MCLVLIFVVLNAIGLGSMGFRGLGFRIRSNDVQGLLGRGHRDGVLLAAEKLQRARLRALHAGLQEDLRLRPPRQPAVQARGASTLLRRNTLRSAVLLVLEINSLNNRCYDDY